MRWVEAQDNDSIYQFKQEQCKIFRNHLAAVFEANSEDFEFIQSLIFQDIFILFLVFIYIYIYTW